MTAQVQRMSLFERRWLTPGERKMATLVFGRDMPLDEVRILQGPPAPFAAMVPHRRTILFAVWRAARDFSCVRPPEQGWFIHELAHVWQARRGTVLAFAKLRALGREAYGYRLEPGKPFSAFNIEQQAEIARHVFLWRIGVPDPRSPPRDKLEALWPIRQPKMREMVTLRKTIRPPQPA